jgi:hypothetical protein
VGGFIIIDLLLNGVPFLTTQYDNLSPPFQTIAGAVLYNVGDLLSLRLRIVNAVVNLPFIVTATVNNT